jgi:hypothetical protein
MGIATYIEVFHVIYASISGIYKIDINLSEFLKESTSNCNN